MFAYCNNNPVIYTDSCGRYPLQAAFEFFYTWLTGNSGKKSYTKKSRIVKQLQASKKVSSYIDEAIDNYKNGVPLTTGTGEFTAVEDGYELYLSTQHFDYTIAVEEDTRTKGFWWWKHKEKRYTATVEIHDVYNFDEVREWNSFGNVMNNLAIAYDIFVGGYDFDWTATFTYSTKWTDIN